MTIKYYSTNFFKLQTFIMAGNDSFCDDVNCDEVIFGEILTILDEMNNDGNKEGLFKYQSSKDNFSYLLCSLYENI